MTIKEVFLKKIILIPVIIMVLYTLMGFFLVPVLGKNILRNTLSKSLNREVSIEKIAVNPYALTATIEGLKVTGKNKEAFFSAKKIFANISSSSFFTFALEVSEMFLENPRVHMTRNKDASFNFSDLLSSSPVDETASQKKDGDDKDLMGVTLKNIHITQGEIRFEDRVTDVSHVVTDFSLMLPFLSSREKSRHEAAGMDIDFILNQASVEIHVESTPFAGGPKHPGGHEDINYRPDPLSSLPAHP